MRNSSRVSVAVFLTACALSWQASAGPIIGGKEWYQPVDLVGYSWNDFSAVCGIGPCNGLLGGVGPSLTGWTWATIYEVGDLFAATSPHPGGIAEFSSPTLLDYQNFAATTGFLPTTDAQMAINFGISAVAGFSSTLAPGGMAYLGVAQGRLPIFPSPFPPSVISTEWTAATNSDEPYYGAWLYRDVGVPVPATFWLVALGALSLVWSRRRMA